MPAFDPNSAALPDSGIFGLPYNEEESALVIVPVPWEATTSYGGGTSKGPEAVLAASHQVDLAHHDIARPYEPGIFLRPIPEDVAAWNDEARTLAERVIEAGGIGESRELAVLADKVEAYSTRLNQWVEEQTASVLRQGKIAAVLGGDHSTPLGAFRAAAGRFGEFDVLQIDAHMDFRKAYEGFRYSHASISYNALESIPQIRRFTQVGIRDFCEEELDYARAIGGRAAVYFQEDMDRELSAGGTWKGVEERVVAGLGPQVWVTFDIDGLDPALCPGTGTPVPGGLSFHQAISLIAAVARSGRQIIGFDLNEVSPCGESEWDANVGARVLWNLCCWTLASQGKVKLK